MTRCAGIRRSGWWQSGGVSRAINGTATTGRRTATTPSWWKPENTVLGRRDLAANVNWFSKVTAAEDGALSFDAAHATPQASVDLRFEMDTLVLLHTCPHPLNTAAEYPRRAVTIRLSRAAPLAADDFCKNSRPENVRGFANNDLYRL